MGKGLGFTNLGECWSITEIRLFVLGGRSVWSQSREGRKYLYFEVPIYDKFQGTYISVGAV